MSFIRKFKQEEYKRDPPYPLGTKGRWNGNNVEIVRGQYGNKWTWSGYVPQDELSSPGVEILDDSLKEAPASSKPGVYAASVLNLPQLPSGIVEGTRVRAVKKLGSEGEMTGKIRKYSSTKHPWGVENNSGLWLEIELISFTVEEDEPPTPQDSPDYSGIVLSQEELPPGLKEGDTVSFKLYDEIRVGKIVRHSLSSGPWGIDNGTGLWTSDQVVTFYKGNRSQNVYNSEDLLTRLPAGVSEDSVVEFWLFDSISPKIGVIGQTRNWPNQTYRYCISDDDGNVYDDLVVKWKLRDSNVESQKANVISVTNERISEMPMNIRLCTVVEVTPAQAATPSTNAIPESEKVIVGPVLRNFEPVVSGSTSRQMTTDEVLKIVSAEVLRDAKFKDVSATNIRAYVSEPFGLTAR